MLRQDPSDLCETMALSAQDALTEADAQEDTEPYWHAPNRDLFFYNKYAFDRWAGWALLIVFAPLILVLFLLVKLTSRGPGFYRQERVGLNGKKFMLVKLRSMTLNAEKPGEAVWACKQDARVTWLGRILRKLHLDELPQLLNVVRGEMSLVGPRPERPIICESLAEQIDDYYDRVTVKPGVTGLAQINLPPDESVADVRRKQTLDLHYIEETNTWLELRILTATALRMIGIQGETVMKWMRLCRLNIVRAHQHPNRREDGQVVRLDSKCSCKGLSEHPTTSPRHPR